MSTNQALAALQDWALQPMEAVRLHAPELVQHPSPKQLEKVKHWDWDNEHELVLIPGSWSGISKEIALSLVKKGVRVVVLDIQEPAFAHVLLNNAGAGKNGPPLEKSEARFHQVFNVNTISHFLMVKKFLPDMIQRYHGRVVAIASMTSLVSLGRSIDYCCSKASALTFHEGLRQELSIWYDAPEVQTSIFHPSWVRTPMTKRLTSAGEERFKQPLLEPEVVAEAVVKQVLAQSRGQIILPGNRFVISLLRALPYCMQRGLTAAADKELKAVHDWEVKSSAQLNVL
ncbi:hypothetical protein ZTR_02977 [Talaromyces verruculosus]|nr:hypothetical protein ZTR_02977 [Talaromyces verruculosus]